MKRLPIYLIILSLASSMVFWSCSSEPNSDVVEKESESSTTFNEEATKMQVDALVPNSLMPKNIEKNPYMCDSENSVHSDNYNSDVTDAILPIGINSEVQYSFETESTNAPPSVFYDAYNNAYAPYQSIGIAIRDLDSEEIKTLGSFLPTTDDDHPYAIQQSYSFIDNNNNIVAPTTDNRVIMLKTVDENGTILPKFEKILDINVGVIATQILGKEINQTLMSIVFDYEGNLWFTTGGFRVYPERNESGMIGYISRKAIDDTLNGISVDLQSEVHAYETELGEGTENGISSVKEGAVILTNQACYLMKANNGVEAVWKVPYESNGANSGGEEMATVGGGLSWGSGTSPALSEKYAFFCDNLDPINLYCVELATGKLIDTMPVIDELPENMPVSIDNAAISYEQENGDISVVLCNWFGASNPGLADPNSDPSVQSYENLYNPDWIHNGNEAIMPGIERADLNEENQELVSVWNRDDLRSTAMFKLSTATGYLYGYAQDIATAMWQYVILDFETGETVYSYDVSTLSAYNNMAVGMYSDPQSNALYCPTGNFELLRMQDRFAYITDSPYRPIDLDDMGRNVVSDMKFEAEGGEGEVSSWQYNVLVLNSVDKESNTSITLLMNGLSGSLEDLQMYGYDKNQNYAVMADSSWSIDTEDKSLQEETVYEVEIVVQDNGVFDKAQEDNIVDVSILFAR